MTPDIKTHPVRSIELCQAAEEFGRFLDWKVKEGAIARGIKIDPSRREWFDQIRDPRLPKRSFRKRSRRASPPDPERLR